MTCGNDFHELVDLLTAEHDRVLKSHRELASELHYLRDQADRRDRSTAFGNTGGASLYDVPDGCETISPSSGSFPERLRRTSEASRGSFESLRNPRKPSIRSCSASSRMTRCDRPSSEKPKSISYSENVDSCLEPPDQIEDTDSNNAVPAERDEIHFTITPRLILPDERGETGECDLLRITGFRSNSFDDAKSVASTAVQSRLSRNYSKMATAGHTRSLQFALRFAWVASAPEMYRRDATRVRATPGNLLTSNSNLTSLSKENLHCRGLILAPSSRSRLFWDLVGLVALTYDMVRVPLQAFPMKRTTFDDSMDWITRVFWTLDMPASLFVGFYRKGELIKHWYPIVKHYLCTWFTLDAGLIASDWLTFYLEKGNGSSNSNNYIRMIRFARFGRLLRLIRLFKLQRILQGFEDLIDTEALSIYLRMLKPMIFISCLNHILACAWFGIGTSDNYQERWVKAHEWEEANIPYLYLTSLHWSLSQFTVGNMDVHPHNTTERLFTVAVMMLGLSSFSSLLGGISNAVTQLRELKTDETRQLWLLRRYLKDYGISQKLSVRIFKYCDYAWRERRKKVQEQEVFLLQLLTHQLRDELNCEIQLPHLELHPLFAKMARLRSSTMDRICSKSLVNHHLACSDYVYQAGDPGTRMVFLIDGDLLYTQLQACQEADGRSDSTFEEKFMMNIETGMWTSEATLWTPWVQMGDLRASRECRLVCLEAANFCELMLQMQTMAWQLAKCYAARFIRFLNQSERLSDILQLEFHPSQVLAAMIEEITLEAANNTGDPDDQEWILQALEENWSAKRARNRFNSLVAQKSLLFPLGEMVGKTLSNGRG